MEKPSTDEIELQWLHQVIQTLFKVISHEYCLETRRLISFLGYNPMVRFANLKIIRNRGEKAGIIITTEIRTISAGNG